LRKSSAYVNYYVHLILLLPANSLIIGMLNDIDGAQKQHIVYYLRLIFMCF